MRPLWWSPIIRTKSWSGSPVIAIPGIGAIPEVSEATAATEAVAAGFGASAFGPHAAAKSKARVPTIRHDGVLEGLGLVNVAIEE